jgi:hypothetical protein
MVVIPDKSKYNLSLGKSKYTNPFFQVNKVLSDIYITQVAFIMVKN